MRSFAAPDTHFHLIRSDTPVNVDGFKIGEPTGEVECLSCGSSSQSLDDIGHDPTCEQRFVRSRWFLEAMRDER